MSAGYYLARLLWRIGCIDRDPSPRRTSVPVSNLRQHVATDNSRRKPAEARPARRSRPGAGSAPSTTPDKSMLGSESDGSVPVARCPRPP